MDLKRPFLSPSDSRYGQISREPAARLCDPVFKQVPLTGISRSGTVNGSDAGSLAKLRGPPLPLAEIGLLFLSAKLI